MNIQYYFEKQIALINTNIFNDNRGSFTELYNKKTLKNLALLNRLFRIIIQFPKKNLL